MKNKPSILVSSTDSYEDCWLPFFSLLEKNFKNIEDYDVYLVSDTKTFKHKFVKNITVSKNSKILSWSDRILKSLEIIESDIIFLLMDDYFLMSNLDHEKLDNFIEIIDNNKNIANIRLVNQKHTVDSVYEKLDKLKNFASYKISLQPGLWRKKYLKELLNKGETPWEFEILGTIRAFCYPKKILVVKEEFSGLIYDSKPYGGIIKGKWVDNEYKEIKSSTGLKMITNRGFTSYQPNKNKIKRKLMLVKNTFNNKKSVIYSILFFLSNILGRNNSCK